MAAMSWRLWSRHTAEREREREREMSVVSLHFTSMNTFAGFLLWDWASLHRTAEYAGELGLAR